MREAAGMDRRKLRTRTALLQAFAELFLERGYDAVAVAQVADRANVGRSTLYEHFRTKDDLLKASLDRPFRALAIAAEPDADVRVVLRLLDHIRAHAAAVRLLLAQPMRSRIARVLAEHITATMTSSCPNRPATELRAIALAEGQLALIERWLFGPVLVSPDAVAEEIIRLARAVMYDV
jgi:AcrR family transcriptional regulator